MFPEEEVIRRIVEGETELFALLADRYGRAVHALVYRIVGNPEDAEEVTQEVLLKAFARLADFRGRSSFATWLHRIACNTAVSFARRRHPLTHFDERQLALLPDDARSGSRHGPSGRSRSERSTAPSHGSRPRSGRSSRSSTTRIVRWPNAPRSPRRPRPT